MAQGTVSRVRPENVNALTVPLPTGRSEAAYVSKTRLLGGIDWIHFQAPILFLIMNLPFSLTLTS